jgi:DNA-binding MarR family transcriptional regulator
LVDHGVVAKVAAADDRRRQLLALTARGRRSLEPAPGRERRGAATAEAAESAEEVD